MVLLASMIVSVIVVVILQPVFGKVLDLKLPHAANLIKRDELCVWVIHQLTEHSRQYHHIQQDAQLPQG